MNAPIQAYSKKELAILYGVSDECFKGWCKRVYKRYPDDFPEKNRRAKIFTPHQIEVLFRHLGAPNIPPK